MVLGEGTCGCATGNKGHHQHEGKNEEDRVHSHEEGSGYREIKHEGKDGGRISFPGCTGPGSGSLRYGDIPRESLDSCNSSFYQDQDIFTVLVPVRDFIHDPADKIDSQPPDFPIFDTGIQFRFRDR